jgi:hypothetical protein
MRTLEFKDICGYLPYGLYAEYTNLKTIDIINSVTGLPDNNDIKLEIGFLSDEHIWMYKPILRPLSDLCKTITHKGKEIVPIVELAKIAYPKTDWYLVKGGAEYYTGYYYVHLSFAGGSFFKSNGDVENQYQLFDFLHELKIDYRGLIDEGLAINCNKLNINPYR